MLLLVWTYPGMELLDLRTSHRQAACEREPQTVCKGTAEKNKSIHMLLVKQGKWGGGGTQEQKIQANKKIKTPK